MVKSKLFLIVSGAVVLALILVALVHFAIPARPNVTGKWETSYDKATGETYVYSLHMEQNGTVTGVLTIDADVMPSGYSNTYDLEGTVSRHGELELKSVGQNYGYVAMTAGQVVNAHEIQGTLDVTGLPEVNFSAKKVRG